MSYISWTKFLQFHECFVFINSFQDEKDFNGLPKIALRKSETKTLRNDNH